MLASNFQISNLKKNIKKRKTILSSNFSYSVPVMIIIVFNANFLKASKI